jgi:hypothetical protein
MGHVVPRMGYLMGVFCVGGVSVSEVIGCMQAPVASERGLGGGGIAPGELELGTQIQVGSAIH